MKINWNLGNCSVASKYNGGKIAFSSRWGDSLAGQNWPVEEKMQKRAIFLDEKENSGLIVIFSGLAWGFFFIAFCQKFTGKLICFPGKKGKEKIKKRITNFLVPLSKL